MRCKACLGNPGSRFGTEALGVYLEELFVPVGDLGFAS